MLTLVYNFFELCVRKNEKKMNFKEEKMFSFHFHSVFSITIPTEAYVCVYHSEINANEKNICKCMYVY